MAISAGNAIPVHSPETPLRLAILMDHPSPHMTPLLDALARRFDCTAEVIYFRRRAPRRDWGSPVGELPFEFLPGPDGLRFHPGLLRVMERKKADAWIINSVYSSPNTWAAALWLSFRSTPWVFMNEPPRPRAFGMGSLKSRGIRLLFRKAWGVIGMGKKTAEMYRCLFHGKCPVTSVPYYVNLDSFYRLPLEKPAGNGETLHFMTCCRLIPRKGLDSLFAALRKLSRPDWSLTLVGNGPLRHILEEEARHSPLRGHIHFEGEIPFERRHEAFGGQHVFILSSLWDGWGMVVPEALAAGLPVISTDQVMSGHEFIRDGVNGFVIPAGDPGVLAERMEFFLRHSDQIPFMARAARESIREYRSEIGAERLVRFLSDLVRKNPHPPAGVQDHIFPPPRWRTLMAPQSAKDRLGITARFWVKRRWISVISAIRPARKPRGHRILVYHLVLPEDREIFAEQLKFITDHFRILPLAEILANAGSSNGNKEFSLAFTFDDGFRILMGDCLEFLEKYKIKATFFVSAGFIGLGPAPEKTARFSQRAHHYALPLEPMRPEDLQKLAQLGHEIGSHGVSHISLQSFSQDQARRELTGSREKIAKWTGILPAGFAYPYGHTRSVLGNPPEWVQQAGYEYAATLRRGAVQPDADPYLLPREHVEGNWPLSHLRYFLLR